MFTGIIEEIGTIDSITSIGAGKKIRIKCKNILSDSKIDNSISINGVCQTITDINGYLFEFISVEETLRKTTINNWKVNQKVNLERALKLSDRLGGHLLLGHVDTTGLIKNIIKLSASTTYSIQSNKDFIKYLIPQGSIAIDGASLTISKIENEIFTVSIIPYTYENTILKFLNSGDSVNIEFDVIGKYVENLMSVKKKSTGFTFDQLKEMGF